MSDYGIYWLLFIYLMVFLFAIMKDSILLCLVSLGFLLAAMVAVVKAEEPLCCRDGTTEMTWDGPTRMAQASEPPEPPDCSGDRCVHFGVRVTPSDIAIKTMYGLCMLHQPVMGPVDPDHPGWGVKVIDNADWWPNPCNEVQAKFRDSGAQAKWEEIEKRDKANQLEMVKRGLGK